MNTYKLKYTNKNEAIEDLFAKGVITSWSYVDEEETEKVAKKYGQGTHSIVEIGLIVDVEGTYDADFKELTAPVFADGYHFDVMSENEIDFENAVEPENPRHTFAGYEQ
jgi:hypothetical protein